MKTCRRYFGFLIILLGLSVQCFAEQSYKIDHDEANKTDKYYVQPGGIYLASNGIYASIDGVLIPISTLCADELGIFVPYGEIIGRLVKCPFCQRWYDPDDRRGHKCSGPPN